MSVQRVEDRGLLFYLALPQLLLSSLQNERLALDVRHRVHLPSRQLLQALLRRAQGCDQFRHLLICIPRGHGITGCHAATASSPNACSTFNPSLRLPMIF